ncbi:MAG: VWA domain-containing protein [Candidatus Nealsonbacteria bacterium]|nr:VWA domain-containing protein [Candidatus Nealsonbacteria bacterium]
MFDLSLQQDYSFTLMAAVAAVAILLVWVFYRRAFAMLRPGQWRLLLALRIAAVLLIVLLLFRPTVNYHKELEGRPAVIFVLDTSSSMSISDDATGVTRFNQARQRIESWWEKLEPDFDLHLIEFSELARPLPDAAALSGLMPNGKATSLSRALVAAARLKDDEDQPVDADAVILLSDGVHNSARSPLEVAAKMKTPVHTVGVGASLRSDASYRDVQLAGMDCPDRLTLNNLARIKASIEGVGLEGRVIDVVLSEDDRQIDTVKLTLDAVKGSQEVEFEFRPEVKGRHTYTVGVPPLAEEKIAENNQRSAVALVVEPGIRVLYIEGTLRAEFGAIVDRFLAKDPDIEFCALVQTRPNKFLRRTNDPNLQLETIPTDAETINTFDVFIIGDLDASYLNPEQQALIVARIRAGAGLVMLGGYHSLGPGGYGGTPIGDVLPIVPGDRDVGQITEPVLPVLTPEGVRHPILANINGFFPTEQAEPKIPGLPPLDGCTRVEGPRPGATVLATVTTESGPMPVLAVQPVDRGRTAVFCGDTTRKWQQRLRASDQESPFMRFWGQTVRWAAGRDDAVETGAGVIGSTDKAYYEPEEPIRISAVVRGPDGEGARDAKVVAKIRGPTGRPDKVDLTAVPGPAGHYSGTFEPKTAGSFQIEIEARVGEQTIAAKEKLVVEVGRPLMEFEKLDLDERTLAAIAADTGGRYVHVTTADYLIDQLDRTQRKKRISMNFPEYEWPMLALLWLLFVAALTAEWVLRKRFQLR